MMMIKKLALFATPLFLVVGCSVNTDPQPSNVVVVEPAPTVPAGNGNLTVEWTIDGVKNAAECTQSGSNEIEISIKGSRGEELAAYRQACTAFATSITLAPGSYGATAVLVDANNVARTTVLPIDPFVIRGNDVLTVPIEFPADSFL